SIVGECDMRDGSVVRQLPHLDPDYVVRRFPTIAEMCRQVGLDLARDPIPVSPAAHYVMGGVETDEWGRTSLPGLFAAGEVACTGVHGANRLASNSLLEGLVFGARAAAAMQEPPQAAALKRDRIMADGRSMADGTRQMAHGGSAGTEPSAIGHLPSAISDVRDLMWRDVGLSRTRDGLLDAVGRLELAWRAADARIESAPADADAWREANLTLV